jgi:hypothetical protein
LTGLLLTIAFLASATIALSHVVNRRFVAPRYDCALNLVAFASGGCCRPAGRLGGVGS